ncbi:olfactory receptor 2K2-like [Discoglossus pictus]
MIILVTITESNLQTPMYLFLTNLSFIDILYSSTVVPRMLKDLLSKTKTILFEECIGLMYFGLSMGTIECILLPIMAYDRYIAICHPLHYTTIMKRSVCIRLAAGTWICGFFLSSFLIAFIISLPFCNYNEINHFSCEPSQVVILACTDLFMIKTVIFVIGILNLMTPIICILVSYVKIIITMLNMTYSTRLRKMFSTCGSHLIVVTLFYSMAIATYMKPMSIHSWKNDKMIAIVYTVITPMINPLIYTLRNKDFKIAFNNMKKRIMLSLQN